MGLFDFLKKKKKPEVQSAPKPQAVQPPAAKPQPVPQAPSAPAKKWEPPKPAPRTELGDRLKQRFIEFDIHGSAEQLTPYFEEALEALRDHGDDAHRIAGLIWEEYNMRQLGLLLRCLACQLLSRSSRILPLLRRCIVTPVTL